MAKSRARKHRHGKARVPLVLVEWLDSHYAPGWHTGARPKRGLTCYSVGWLVHDGKHAKTVAAHITDEDPPQRNGEMTIPACAVVSIQELDL